MSIDATAMKRALEALQTKGVYAIEFTADGQAVKVMGHPDNAFVASAFWLDPHTPNPPQFMIEYGGDSVPAVISQILFAINDQKKKRRR